MDEQKPKRGRPRQSELARVLDYRPATRACLICGKPFASQGPGNRQCKKCKAQR